MTAINQEPGATVDPQLLSRLESTDAAAAPQPAAEGASTPPGAAPGGVPPAPVDHVKDARELLQFIVEGVGPAYPSIPNVYTPEVIERLSIKAGPVLAKYNVNLDQLFGKWGPEVMLAIGIFPLIRPTIEAIKTDRAQGKKPADQVAPPPPAAATVAAAGADPLSKFSHGLPQ